ncbi:DNA internalization-related competence protein ComEC/Rec2 [Microbulbifer sp. HZ11]|uniref:DNA internalization-related competence protein ComEC/Rec2 n=1 Tax=Microbulbifer sp. HZ11 TaxID=1453501 RepID=UPI0009DF06FF|nr:DNA internalization-related competence protein ComEC/Rec2 [Microbulbifer sp. HZ11]
MTGIRLDDRPNILLGLWACAAGIGQVAYWPELPGSQTVAGAALLGLLAVTLLLMLSGVRPVTVNRRVVLLFRVVLPFLFGTCWALWANHQALERRLPESLHGTDHTLELEVVSLPQAAPAVSFFGAPRAATGGYLDARFRARVTDGEDARFVGRILQLGWYRMAPADAERLEAGSRWRMRVRVKQPRGSVNPHTFDYEAWLLEQDIFATGYVRDRDNEPLFLRAGAGLNRIREDLRSHLDSGAQLQELAYKQAPLMRALLLGDRSGIDEATRKLLQNTGTAHLLAISGLHVGMVAGCFFLFGGVLGRTAAVLGAMRAGNPVYLGGAAGLFAALTYTLISGAPLSAQRALVMAMVALGAVVLRRRFDGHLGLALALCGILFWQPLAVLNAGFWLSFIAVGALLLRFQGRVRVDDRPMPSTGCLSLGTRWRTWLVSGVHSQWAIVIGMLIPSVLIFHGVSLSGLVVNLFAIPWVGLLILPLILVGALCPVEPLAAGIWALADLQLGWLVAFLESADRVAPGWYVLPVPGPWVILLAAVGGVLLVMPPGVPGRGLGWLLIPAIAVGGTGWQRPLPDSFELTVLDVGQGLAVTAVSGAHTVIFDTGASSASGWSAGSSIVAPYLQAQGRQKVDALIVSHGDRDHAGGVGGVLEQLEVDNVVAPGSLGQRLLAKPGSRSCRAGHTAQYGSFSIHWLWPRTTSVNGEENDHSCVGLLQWNHVRILLTGDIPSRVEMQLAALYPDLPAVDLLIAPHHGSRTSSSAALIAWAQPSLVVFSAGYKHRFGHPHPDVTARYRAAGATLFNTAQEGAIQFQWDDTGGLEITRARQGGRFWYQHHSDKKDNNQILSHRQ